MNRRVIAGLNGPVLIFWLSVFALIGVYALHEDLTSEGLKRTQIFLVLGNLTYPLFYGAIAFLLFRFTSMFRRRHDYVAFADNSISFGQRVTPLADIRQVDVGRNWLGLRELIVRRENGPDIRLKAYALSRQIDEVVSELKAVVGQAHSNSTMT